MDTSRNPSEPLHDLLDPQVPGQQAGEAAAVEDGIGLCLSGGGYRAMLFHLGSLWRLNETGLMQGLQRVSSVSGGSITAGMLGKAWGELTFEDGVATNFDTKVVTPIRALAGKTLDVKSVLGGVFGRGSASERVADAYRDALFGDATLQALPKAGEGPRFVITAANLQSGALWRFSQPYAGDWKVGLIENPTISLATAVAASSAFPPVLSPTILELDEGDYKPNSGDGLQYAPFTTKVILSDGGVYDNLGLEPVLKRNRTVLVSDAGGALEPEKSPPKDWFRHTVKVLNVIDGQVRNLRKRQVIGSFLLPERDSQHREGAYWSVRSDISHFTGLSNPLPCPFEKTFKLAKTPTRLASLSSREQERLINWGYAACDAGLRTHVDRSLAAPGGFPYPGAGVG